MDVAEAHIKFISPLAPEMDSVAIYEHVEIQTSWIRADGYEVIEKSTRLKSPGIAGKSETRDETVGLPLIGTIRVELFC